MISYNYLPAPRLEDIICDKQAESAMPEYGSGGDRLPCVMPEDKNNEPEPNNTDLAAIDAIFESENSNNEMPKL